MKGNLGLVAAAFANFLCIWRAVLLQAEMSAFSLISGLQIPGLKLKWAAVRRKPCLVPLSKKPHTKIPCHSAILIKVSWNFGQVLGINYNFISSWGFSRENKSNKIRVKLLSGCHVASYLIGHGE